MVKIIAIINGSPSNENNSGFLAKESKRIIEKIGGTAKIINVIEALNDLDSPFCTACTNPCQQVCESQSEILKNNFNILREAKAILMISPVYFGTVTGELKAFWDLTRHLRNEKALYNTIGGAVSIGASKYGGQETTIKTMHDMMLVQGMIIVGNSFDDNMAHQGACLRKPAESDEEGLKSLDRICNRLVEISNKF